MADVNRGNRPLSPHLQIYKPQLHSAMSIFFRISGVGLTLGGLLTVAWFLAAATGPEAFARIDWVITSYLGDLVMVGSLAALLYHLIGGIRHLVWDFGYGFEKESVRKSGFVVLGATAAMLIVVLIFVQV
ncbi:MAG: succinate dehydrogenase, cytochrome b556 subunit [Pseudomonadota bacterium]